MSLHIQIIGAGALGKMLAHLLSQAGFKVKLYGRSGLYSGSTWIKEGDREFALTLNHDDSSPSEPALCLVTTKAYDVPEVLSQGRFAHNGPMVLLCNGYIEPLIKDFRSIYPDLEIRKGVVTRGAKPAPDGRLILSAKGSIAWGGGKHGLTPIEKEIFARVEGVQFDPFACRNRKVKWYCNTVLNTLAGAFRLPSNAAALTHPLYEELNAEVFALMRELWPGEFSDARAMKQILDDLIKMTEANENSMAVDVRLGRRTEIEVLSGVALTVNDALIKFPRLTELHKTLQSEKK